MVGTSTAYGNASTSTSTSISTITAVQGSGCSQIHGFVVSRLRAFRWKLFMLRAWTFDSPPSACARALTCRSTV